VDISLDSYTSVKNISFLNYPKYEGITIPLDILEKRLCLRIFVTIDNSLSKVNKINILNNKNNDEILLDNTIKWYEIIKEGTDNNKLIIYLGYGKNEKKTIIYDSLGNKKIFYDKKNIDSKNILDLRKYSDCKMISYNGYDKLDEFIITPNKLKNINILNIKNIFVKSFKILGDNNMLLNPNILELSNVKINVFSIKSNDSITNIIYLGDEYGKRSYIYLNEKNELKVIKEDNNKEYKFLYNENNSGVIIKHKKKLKYDLILNNKSYHINKMFVNWWLNNKSKYDRKIIPFEYIMFSKGNENIFDYGDANIEYISDYIFDTLLEEIIENNLCDNFDAKYLEYLAYINNLKILLHKGYSYRALIYLHKNGFDNITGIKNNISRDIDDKELIDTFNNLGKKLIKRRDKNESK